MIEFETSYLVAVLAGLGAGILMKKRREAQQNKEREEKEKQKKGTSNKK